MGMMTGAGSSRLSRGLAIVVATVFGLLPLALVGCATPKTEFDGATPLPAAEDVLAGQRDAVRGLERFWARTVVQVDGADAAGNELSEQANGVLQVIAPTQLAMTFEKLGETYFYLGSNDEMYWWFDLLSEQRVATIGRHVLATPEKSASLGLPVHPLDLIELLGITPLPDDVKPIGWTIDGRVIVEHANRWGTRRVFYDPDSWLPWRVELLDHQGDVLASADLSRHARTVIQGDALNTPWVAGRLIITAQGFDGEVRVSLFEPKNRRIRDVAFDLGRLAEDVYKVNAVRDLDTPHVPSTPPAAVEATP